jgi:hypothetical protein
MPPANSPTNAFRTVAAYVVGAAVHGSSLFFMIHGLVRNAWYGHVFALMYAVVFLAWFITFRKARRRTALELQKLLREHGESTGE